MSFTAAHPSLLWLIPLALALIVLFRLLRARRRQVDVGSLLIWRRLAAVATPPRKKRLIIDRSLVLQVLAATTLIAAMTIPAAKPASARGKTILLALDNGPLSRARDGGTPLLAPVRAKANALLAQLNADDRVYVAVSSPIPALQNQAPVGKRDAEALVNALSPALSGPDGATFHAFVLDRARALDAAAIVVSLQSNPEKNGLRWLCVSDSSRRLPNVAIVDAGSIRVGEDGRRVLVRIVNFSDEAISGTVQLEGGASVPLTLKARGEEAVAFAIPANAESPVRISWRGPSTDALPDDDMVVLLPQTTRAPRVRFSAPLPALESFFRSALNADVVTESDKEVDLDIFVGSVPENFPASAKAALFVAPSRGYRGYFDVGANVLNWPKARRGEADALNVGIPADDSGIAIAKAVELLRTGDFKTLLEDITTSRPLAIRFVDERARPCFVLAFVPNAELPAERLLDPPLAALLTRILKQAAQSGPPFIVTRASEVESRNARAFPANWTASNDGASGVLEERASDLVLGTPSGGDAAPVALDAGSVRAASTLDLTPWLAVLGALCVLAEIFASRRKVLAT